MCYISNMITHLNRVATVSVTTPEIDGGNRRRTSLNQALGGSTTLKRLSAMVHQKSAWWSLPRPPLLLPHFCPCFSMVSWSSDYRLFHLVINLSDTR